MSTRKDAIILMIIAALFFLLFFNLGPSYDPPDVSKEFFKHNAPNTSKKCQQFIQSITPQFDAILIDENILEMIVLDKCVRVRTTRPIKVAVPIIMYPVVNSIYQVVPYYEENEKFYTTIIDGDQKRIMPRELMVDKRFVHQYTDRFLQSLRRSRFIQCRNINMNRKDSSRVLPLADTVQNLYRWAEFLTNFNMYASIAGGTLLGWYRECSITSHTTDTDFAVDAKEHNPLLLEMLLKGNTPFVAKRKLGKVESGYELTVVPRGASQIPIDLFYLYHDDVNDLTWLAGTTGDGRIQQFKYPRIASYCAGDLLGYLFWVPCNVESILEAEYGPQWYIDAPSSEWYWDANAKTIGKYTSEELKEVYVVY